MFSIADIAKKINATIVGDDQVIISQLAPISRAKSGDLTFLMGRSYHRYLQDTKASAVILTEENVKACPVTALVVKNPELAFARIATLFQINRRPLQGVHPSTVIAKSAVIDPSVSIGPHCVIGDNVVIGANTVISAGVIIEENVTIGSDCYFHARVTVSYSVVIGNRVIVQSGAVIGGDGFGLAQDQGRFEKIPQLGSVLIADDVEIGANSCIDRGALDNTIIETGVKIDNLVQIAHNVQVGAHTVMAGCSSVAGSTKIGKHCMIAGAVNIGGHLTICDGAIFTGCAMVTKSVKEPGVYSSGTGLMPNAVWHKSVVRFKQLDEWVRAIKHERSE